MQRSLSRRRLLSATGTIGLVALAGCSGVLSDGDDSGDDDADDRPANESDENGDGNTSDGETDGDGSSPPEDGDDAADDETPPMPEPVDWTGEERGTISVGPGGEFVFDPDAVRIAPGTLVRWLWESDGHSVTPVDRPDGAEWTGVEAIENDGHTYEYVCEPHEEAGMRGYVVVSDVQR